MTDRELTQRITDYLTGGGLFNPEMANHEAVRDLLIDCRDALAQPVQTPVAWLDEELGLAYTAEELADVDATCFIPLFTTAPQSKQWVGLTDEEGDLIARQSTHDYEVINAVESKLRDKNR